jgi:hypothetical protein
LNCRVLRGAFERLERHESKGSRAVLRGLGGSNALRLPDPAQRKPVFHLSPHSQLDSEFADSIQIPTSNNAIVVPLTRAQTRSTQRERDYLLGGHRRAFRPFQFKHSIAKLSA